MWGGFWLNGGKRFQLLVFHFVDQSAGAILRAGFLVCFGKGRGRGVIS